MKHISTIIDDLELNDDLAHEYELDRRNDEFYSPELEFTARVNNLSKADLDNELTCSFCPSVDSFESTELARQHYIAFLVEEYFFFLGYNPTEVRNG